MSFYNIFANREFLTDRDTISPVWDLPSVQFHYSFLEAAILRYVTIPPQSILDIGSGAGHWIKFYQSVYLGIRIQAIDISRPNAAKLGCICADIVDYCEGQYDIVNTIGILHHIMKDAALAKALHNIRQMTKGLLFIGTRFDFLESPKEPYRRFRTLKQWKDLLADFQIIGIERSNPPIHLRKHLDLIVCA